MKVISPLLVLIFCVSIRAYSTTNHPQTDLTCPEANYFSVDNQNQTVCLPCDNRDNSVYGTYIANVWNDAACTKVNTSAYDDYLFILIPLGILFVISVWVCFRGEQEIFRRMKTVYNASAFLCFFIYIRWCSCVLTKPIAIASDYSAVMYQVSNISVFIIVVLLICAQYLYTRVSLSEHTQMNNKVKAVRKVLMIESLLMIIFILIIITLARVNIPLLDENNNEIDKVELASKYRHELTYIGSLIISILRLIFLGFYLSLHSYEVNVALPEPPYNPPGGFIPSAPQEQSYQNALVTVTSNGVQGAYIEENCVVCLHGKPDVTFLPCRHQVVCSQNQCYKPLQTCPKCRAPLSSCLIITPPS